MTGPAAATARFPGTRAIVDGSEAIASVEARISEAACAYPITPSTTMAAIYQQAVADGRTNLWGTRLQFIEPESEHSSASAAEGFALAGGRVTNFTAGQGLILMKEVLYVIAGKRLPVVFHVGARALTSQALNIHAGHDDIMGVADTGWAMLVARNAQEAADLTAIARRVAEETETPCFVVQDGFLTTHTLEDLFLPEDDLLRDFVGDPRDRLRSYFEPDRGADDRRRPEPGQLHEGPHRAARLLRPAAGRARRGDGRLDAAHRPRLRPDRRLPMRRCERDHRVDGHHRRHGRGRRRSPSGRWAGRRQRGRHRLPAVPGRVTRRGIGGCDDGRRPRTDRRPGRREQPADPGGQGRALRSASTGSVRGPRVKSASAGLGSRDVTPGDLVAMFDWLAQPGDDVRRHVVLGVHHPLALATKPVDLGPAGAFRVRGHSVGGFGSVTTNKLLAALVGELFGRHVQAYPRYGSEKKGLPTTYFLTIADESDPIPRGARARWTSSRSTTSRRSGRAIRFADSWTAGRSSSRPRSIDPEAIWAAIPAAARSEMLARGIHCWALDTTALARAHAPRPDLLVRMQGVALVGVFLRVAPFAAEAGFDRTALLDAVRTQLTRFFGKRGGAVVDANLAVVSAAYDHAIDVTGAVTGLTVAPRHDLVPVGASIASPSKEEA